MYSVIKVAWCAKNYIANYTIFQEHQLNSRRFPELPGVADTLVMNHAVLLFQVLRHGTLCQ